MSRNDATEKDPWTTQIVPDPDQCRAARCKLDWSADRLAGLAQCGRTTIFRFEKRKSMPLADTLQRIRSAFEVHGIHFATINGRPCVSWDPRED